MEALNLFHRLVPGRQRRYRLRTKEHVNRSMDSILDGLDGSKRRATYPANSEVNILLPFVSIMPTNRVIVRARCKSRRTKEHAIYCLAKFCIACIFYPAWNRKPMFRIYITFLADFSAGNIVELCGQSMLFQVLIRLCFGFHRLLSVNSETIYFFM